MEKEKKHIRYIFLSIIVGLLSFNIIYFESIWIKFLSLMMIVFILLVPLKPLFEEGDKTTKKKDEKTKKR